MVQLIVGAVTLLLVSIFPADGKTSVIGNEAVSRSILDTWTDGVYMPDETQGIQEGGRVVRWSAYIQTPRADATFTASVWRLQSGSTYSLVGFTEIPTGTEGAIDVDLRCDEQIEVQAGDVIGFSFTGGSTVPFDTHSCGHKLLSFSGAYDMVVGDEHDFPVINSLPCRQYSLSATIVEGTPSGYGNDAVDREILDGWTEGVYMPDSTEGIASDGQVVGWSVYIGENRADASFKASVWRLVSGNRYTLVGYTDLPTSPMGQYNVYLGLDDIINVQAGDVIGFSFEGGSTVPFDTYTCDHNLLSFSGSHPMIVGNEYTFPTINSLPCRLYSLEAIVYE